MTQAYCADRNFQIKKQIIPLSAAGVGDQATLESQKRKRMQSILYIEVFMEGKFIFRERTCLYPVKYGSELTDGFNVGYHVTIAGKGARNNIPWLELIFLGILVSSRDGQSACISKHFLSTTDSARFRDHRSQQFLKRDDTLRKIV